MDRYAVRFQLQSGSNDIFHDNYHSDQRPCTKREGVEHLGRLWAKGKDYYRDSVWQSRLKEAIEKSERAVRNASNVSASANRNVSNQQFDYDNRTYRVDIAVEAGDGHFKD